MLVAVSVRALECLRRIVNFIRRTQSPYKMQIVCQIKCEIDGCLAIRMYKACGKTQLTE
jgi:hypothetical protein